MNRSIVKLLMLIGFMSVFEAQISAQEVLVSPRRDEVVIGNTKIYREDKELVIDYQILMGDDVRACDVDVIMYVDGEPIKKLMGLGGDYGKISEPGAKQIRFNLLEQNAELADKEIKFTLNVKNKDVLDDKYIVMPVLSIASPISYGVMVGYVKKFGGYLKFKSNFNSIKSSYSAYNNGTREEGGYIWTSGDYDENIMQISVGGMWRISKWCYSFLGLGYGKQNVFFEDINGKWANISDLSSNGIATELGFMFKLGPIMFSQAVSTIGFKHVGLDIGIGVAF